MKNLEIVQEHSLFTLFKNSTIFKGCEILKAFDETRSLEWCSLLSSGKKNGRDMIFLWRINRKLMLDRRSGRLSRCCGEKIV